MAAAWVMNAAQRPVLDGFLVFGPMAHRRRTSKQMHDLGFSHDFS